ncbi:expressed unknown protein [Seminavis robusta]|uniref:Vps72/YL1 C-terminal domain-containing protein n=1 Tax=Seminavis robusta TaxID=568900 RepID=A0A9N8ER89_9STRA|nr:expressed unknown protein [Seminavis robusta]|eukprot:Sro1660_g289280.1 n/a (225) ;mRNA; f:4498-5172
MSGSAVQRKAWNEAMRNAAGASATLLPGQQQNLKRRSDRRKKQDRRDKARKSVAVASDNDEFQAAVWLDALEDVDPNQQQDDDDEYNALEELDDESSSPEKAKSKSRKRKSSSSNTATSALPKRFMARTLGSILMEEANRPGDHNSSARAFVDSEALILTKHKQLPRRKFCSVTGLKGIFTEPKSGLPYANMKALEQIRERAPPWMTLSGNPSYFEASKSLREE